MAQVKYLLLHEFSDPFLLGVHAVSEGICRFLTCVTDSEIQKLPPPGWKLPKSRIPVQFTKRPPWHCGHM